MDLNNSVKMGKLKETWNQGKAKTITFCVTEDCNLACKYCYMTGKNSKNKMSFDIAKRAVDYILSNRNDFNNESVIWEFIGGEPFLEIDLIDQVSDYIKQQMFILGHPWFENYRFSFSSNGVLYHTEEVQRYINKNLSHTSIGLSVDGNKIKHDLQRVKKDGTGSYDDVIKNVTLWLKQFPGMMTKSTFAHDDLPYLKDSIISLWNLGIDTVAANAIFEDVWSDGDDIIFENQLRELADYILENRIWNDYSVRFFDPNIGFPLNNEELNKNFCGTGQMLAIDTNGDLYSCVRFYDFSLNNRKAYKIGDINNGINRDLLRPFLAMDLKSQSNEECINCEVASGCAWCTACNYDNAATSTIYQRATFICKMHKANVRANKYFWENFSIVSGLVSEREKIRIKRSFDKPKYLYFINSSNIVPHCLYKSNNSQNVMSSETLHKGLDFAKKNGFIPIIWRNETISSSEYKEEEFMTIIPNKSNYIPKNSLVVYDNNIDPIIDSYGKCTLLVTKEKISEIFQIIKDLFKYNKRIEIVLQDIGNWNNEDINLYSEQLENIIPFVVSTYKCGDPISLNILTDILNLKSMNNCGAGNNTFTLAPNGKFYICPAFYFDNPESHVGSLEDGLVIKNEQLLKISNAPICQACDAYHCKRCKFLNVKMTGEINIPSKMQCIISHIERRYSKQLQTALEKENCLISKNYLMDLDYLDPLDKIIKNKKLRCY